GSTFLQHLALLGSVYGFVDVLVKLDPAAKQITSSEAGPVSRAPTAEELTAPPQLDDPPPSTQAAGDEPSHSPNALPARIAQAIRLEIVEPARALPFLSPTDWRNVRAYAQVYQVQTSSRDSRRALPRRVGFFKRLLGSTIPSANEQRTIVEILTADSWQRYEDEQLVDSGINSLGEIPLVHIQNLAVPFEYAGTSDVEVLIPLQDELNTRLSDRANRITMQSFKMYLGKCIEGFNQMPVAPGRMWTTENDQAQVIEFGGDSASPSEDHHITELREALDKCSGVTPIAAGAIRGRIGHLTSAAALRVTMMALIAKTQRKRLVYGEAIARMCQLSLAWLDRAGLFHTTPDERTFEIEWRDVVDDLTPSPTGRGPG
ncbi:MAG TPA: phage portal protein, partial [Tepidisphaeraceae bacterium]